MEIQESSEEITFGHLIRGIKKLYHSFLIRLYRFSQFLRRNRIPLLVLLIIGFLGNYFWQSQKNPQKKSTLIVQVNFESTSIIYDAVAQLEGKIRNNDQDFLSRYHLNSGDRSVLKTIEISPAVNLKDLLRQYETADEQNHLVTDLLNHVNKNEEFLTSAIFLPQYKRHQITLEAVDGADQSVFKGVMDYLNDQEKLQEVKIVYQKNLESKIHEYKLNIQQIDSLLQRMGTTNQVASPDNQININASPIGSLDRLLIEKRKMMNELEVMEADQLHYDNPVEVLNTPYWEAEGDSLWNRFIQLPLILVGLYLLLAVIIAGLKKGKRLANYQERVETEV